MPLQLTVDKLDALPETVRALYKQDGDKFRLDVDGYEDPAGLKSALDKERKAAKDAVGMAKAWKDLGKTPEEIQALVEAQAQAERDKLTKAGEWDKLKAQLVEQQAVELKAREEKAGVYRSQLERHLVDAAGATALAAAGGSPELLLPHVKARVKVIEENGEFTVRVVDAKGDPRVGPKGEFLTMADLVGEMRANDTFAPAFKAPPASGGGARQSNTPGNDAKTATRSEFDSMTQQNRMAFSKAGGKVVDA